jgi:adenylate cyclase, class 2
MPHEVEVKFLIHDLPALRLALQSTGFREVTRRTHEVNTVYDTRDGSLRLRGELLRLRQYGNRWTLTHKGVSDLAAKHKTRVETETVVSDGHAMHSILLALGFQPTFIYEKMRTEYSDGQGHVVLDETPVGVIGEIEGTPEWIDATAHRLGIAESDYIVKSYGTLFAEWRERTGSAARHMTWAETGTPRPQ